jgi:uncharacterized protein YdhG (YjbR/CyaY superfamily)
MNRAKTKKPGSAAKQHAGIPKTVVEYFAQVPEEARDPLRKLRAAICSALPPGTVEVLSYRIPAFKQKRILVWYAAFAKHCSLFPTAAVLRQFRDELEGFHTSVGTVQFPLNQPIPAELVKKIVRARVSQVQRKD